VGRVLRFLDARWCNGGRLCAWGLSLYIGMSMGGTDHGAITRTPWKTEHACMRWEPQLNHHCTYIGKTERACVGKTERACMRLIGNRREQPMDG